MPFSDPLADGPVIQCSSEKALENGMSVKTLFEQLKGADFKNKPVLLMGYLNPVLQYGIMNFCKDASALGISGVIIPDLPLQEYVEEYRTIFQKYGLKNIFLITPQTSEDRIRLIDEYSSSFIYVVSSASTTGVKKDIQISQEEYFDRIRSMNLKNPLLIGFGISDHKTFSKACEYASGAIIGSAFVKVIGESVNIKNDVKKFVDGITTNQNVRFVSGTAINT
jgi:tryptophan synthase alpha chain